MTDYLSPAARDVVDSIQNTPSEASFEYDIAAALRAAALYCKQDKLILLSIADELEKL